MATPCHLRFTLFALLMLFARGPCVVGSSRPSLETALVGAMTRRRALQGSPRAGGGREEAAQLPLPESTGLIWKEYAEVLEGKESDLNWVLPSSAWRWDRYHSSADVKDLLLFLASRWPQIATVQLIGSSVQGRELWAIQLGSQDARDAAVPSNVQLIGNMHGDEAASAEVLMRFAWDLCRRYGHSQDDLGVTRLLDTTVLHILPTMNPDGYDASPRRRSNAQGVDLNRAFPRLGSSAPRNKRQLRLLPDLPRGTPPEVVAVMNWTASSEFVLSANFHGGALVACFPFDSCDAAGLEYDCPTPEDPTPYHLARSFADKHVRMKHSSRFVDGVVRGSEWYPVLGGMQDWIWYSTGSVALTVEIHQEKEPRNKLKRRLPYLYWEMRDPLLNFVTSVHHSIKGHVLDQQTGEPLQANVLLVALAGGSVLALPGRETTTSAARQGRYTRVLVPGSAYCLLAKADGYAPSAAFVRLNPASPRDASVSIHCDFQMHAADGSRLSAEVPMLGDSVGSSNLSLSALRRMSDKCVDLLDDSVQSTPRN